jgi:four helix bundle protein
MSRYEDLRVWRLAHALSQRVKTATGRFPPEERFELTSQLRRAIRSVPANIVEGSGLGGPRQFARHVRIALGSLREAHYFLLEANEDGYLPEREHGEICDQILHLRILMFRLLKSLDSKTKKASSGPKNYAQ